MSAEQGLVEVKTWKRPPFIEVGHPFDILLAGYEVAATSHMAGRDRDHSLRPVDLPQSQKESHGVLRPCSQLTVEHLFFLICESHLINPFLLAPLVDTELFPYAPGR
jgi:hypothetical protein